MNDTMKHDAELSSNSHGKVRARLLDLPMCVIPVFYLYFIFFANNSFLRTYSYMKAKFLAMKGNSMSGRTKLIDLGKELPKLTEKEAEALFLVHPYVDGNTHKQAAVLLGITKASLEDRISNIFRKIPWLQEDMRRKRAELTARKQNIRRPTRLGDMSGISNDETHDTFFGDRIVERF